MAKKDTVEKEQPVSIEDDIKSTIEAAEEEIQDEVVDDDNTEAESEPEDMDEEAGDEPIAAKGDSDDDGDTEEQDESALDMGDSEEAETDPVEDTEEDTIEAPEHWAAADREVFNKQTKESKEWLLKRHKEMEGSLTRKSQEFASEKRQYDNIRDALKPYEAEFARAGLDHAGAVRQLASWHTPLRQGGEVGKAALLQLADLYKIDITQDDQEYIDPNLASIKQELSALKNQTVQQQQAAQQEKRNQLFQVISAFESETDENGGLKHPHFAALEEDLIKIFNGAASLGKPIDLQDAYNQALSFRQDLAPVKQASKVTGKKVDQLEKVRKAKKAATGIKSSGATKQKRGEMSLEQEIASQIN